MWYVKSEFIPYNLSQTFCVLLLNSNAKEKGNSKVFTVAAMLILL